MVLSNKALKRIFSALCCNGYPYSDWTKDEQDKLIKGEDIFNNMGLTNLLLKNKKEIEQSEKFLRMLIEPVKKIPPLKEIYERRAFLYHFIQIINWVAYKNRKQDWQETLEERNIILSYYEKMVSAEMEQDRKEIESCIEASFEDFEALVEEQDLKKIQNKKNSYEQFKAQKKEIDINEVNAMFSGFMTTIEQMKIRFDEDHNPLITIRKNYEGLLNNIIWPKSSLKHLYQSLYFYYSQMDKFVGSSSQILKTKKSLWASIFGANLYTYLEQISIKKQNKRKPKNIFILGETGTGKESIAKAIGAENIESVNIAAISKTMIEAELFGVAPGAATNVTPRRGHFLRLSGYKDPGTGRIQTDHRPKEVKEAVLFLDEIGDISEDIQVKLLRVIEEQKVRRVGGHKEHEISVRVVAATNKPIYHMINDKRFRRDLFERLVSGGVVSTYPLREKREDIKAIAYEYLKENYAITENLPIKGLGPWLESLEDYKWPGNVRELQRAVDYYCAGNHEMFEDMLIKQKLAVDHSYTENLELEEIFSKSPSLKKVKDLYLKHTVEKFGGNVSRAAQVLGITRQTLAKNLSE